MTHPARERTDVSLENDPAARSVRLYRLTCEFDAALDELERAPAYAKARYQEAVFRVAADLLDVDEGPAVLLERSGRLDPAGVFHGGPWEDPSKLVSDLVGVGLLGEGVYPTVEALSEIRMLGVATGRGASAHVDSVRARGFLRDVCAKNVRLMYPTESEEHRKRPKIFRRAERLFGLILENSSVEGLAERVLEEIKLLCAQRPIRTQRIEELIECAAGLPATEGSETKATLDLYRSATGAGTPLAREAGDPAVYRGRVRDLERSERLEEARSFARTLNATGISSPYHAVVLRWIARRDPDDLGEALGAGEAASAEIGRCLELTVQLVGMAILPHTASGIAGLAGALERGLLHRSEVAGGLRRLADLDIRPDVSRLLLDPFPAEAGLSANAVLLAGAISTLGQPLGIGQGNNPTCQAARGLSLWSLHAPGLLLGMIANAARDGFVVAEFEGQQLRSDELAGGLARDGIDLDLDPVSKLLVPHLDRLYARMMEIVSLRGEDGHKWVNPAMYGRWVPSGFASAIDATHSVRTHGTFVRRFYATHHPDYNDGHELIYPNPVGLMVTDVHGTALGPHAVSIQRIAASGDGLRIYFFNPNNEGRQDWGFEVRPTVSGNGEEPGESSLLFPEFVSRLYAFHFDPHEEGDAFAVPEETVADVSRMARESWGRSYVWVD